MGAISTGKKIKQVERREVKFSVVIPLYNKGKYIKNTIESVLRQSCQDFEIIVVDDGSVDDSLAVVRTIKNDKLTILEQPNQGVSVARNYGIEQAQGTYIAFLDADDQWRENYLETIDHLTVQYPESDLFVTAYDVFLGENQYKHSRRRTPETGCLESYWLTLEDRYDFVWTSATVVRKEALSREGGFRPGEKIGQDLDMWARIARSNPRVAYSSRACVVYNRCAEENARTRVRIAWAGAFIKDLEEELCSCTHTPEELAAIQKKYDKKMTVYIFTAILAGEKQRAMKALRSWRGTVSLYNLFLRGGLLGAILVSKCINRGLYALRMKVF